MATITLEQALYHRPDRQPPALVARSAGFAKPIGARHVAVVRVSDNDVFPMGLRFHFLVVERKIYEAWICDPFILADKLEPSWDAPDPLPKLMIPEEAFAPRTVGQVQSVLKRVKASALKKGGDPEGP